MVAGFFVMYQLVLYACQRVRMVQPSYLCVVCVTSFPLYLFVCCLKIDKMLKCDQVREWAFSIYLFISLSLSLSPNLIPFPHSTSSLSLSFQNCKCWLHIKCSYSISVSDSYQWSARPTTTALLSIHRW